VTELLARLDPFGAGLSWLICEPVQRASHAIVADGRVWIIDPVDHPEAMDEVAALGTPAAVLQLLDRHGRDCATVAARLGVPHLIVPDAVPDSPFRAIPVVRAPGWRETALWWPEASVLVVTEAVGTAEAFTAGHGAAGMHPFLRPLPPQGLLGLRPEHLLVGHGPSVHGPEAAAAIEWAYARARRDLPRLAVTLARMARR
jgi:hypothetical protein